MRKPEGRQWDYLSRAMAGRWDAQRHEDKHSTSIPDVSYACGNVDGWLELKTIPHWPKRASGAVSIPHLESGQVNWLERRGRAGNAHCFMLLAVGEEMRVADWVLVPFHMVREIYEKKLTRDDLAERCVVMSGCRLAEVLPVCLSLKTAY